MTEASVAASMTDMIQNVQEMQDLESQLKGSELRQVPVNLSWENLTVTVPDSKGKVREILGEATGYVEPCSLLAIMGASGGGKSTLLDALAGRLAKNTKVEGCILVNGMPQRLSYGNSAYVTQDDAHLIGTLTVRESISYSAYLRLPTDKSRADKDKIVQDVIHKMGLVDVANTYIGNWYIRGISGGQKRRVSIVMELITRPSLMFLDEPTSGLDSAAAFFIMASIRTLASENRTILAVIHQPSSEVFGLFDQLCLLSGGKALYFGPASRALSMFEAAGVPCPARRNPSDHFLRTINSDFEDVKAYGDAAGIAPLLTESGCTSELSVNEIIEKLAVTYATSPEAVDRGCKVKAIASMQGPPLQQLLKPTVWIALRHTYILTIRSFKNMYRNIGLYWLRVVMYALLMVCIGTIYYNIGDSYNSIQARGAVLFFVVAFLTFMSIAGFPAFIEDMKVFNHERLNGYYGATAFVLSNSFSSLPFLFLISLLSALIGYWLIKLQNDFGRFVYFVLMLFSSLAVVESLMMVIAAIVPVFLMGIAAGAGILGMFMLVCGFFRLPSDLPGPVWKYPFYYLSFHTYAFEGFMTNEFIGLTFENHPPTLPRLTGEEALGFFDLQNKKKWNDLAVSVGMLIAYRLLFLVILKVKEWRNSR